MGNLQEQLAKIEQDLSAEKQKGPEGDQTIIARLESEQAHILEQIMLAEQQEREVHTQEVNETNSDIAISVFDALIPDTKVFESVLGLMEFSDWRSGFYQLFDGALADRTQLMNDKREYDLAQKDEKIRLLSGQGLELQRYLDESTKTIEGLKLDAIAEQENHNDITDDLRQELREVNDRVRTVIAERDEAIEKFVKADQAASMHESKITELEARLAYALEPKESVKPSQSFTDRMHEIKTKNKARIKSAAELAAEGQLGFRGKVILPEIKQQENQFRDFPAIESNGNQLPSAQVDATVGSQFPSAPNVGTVQPPDLGNQAQPTGVGMAEHSNDGKTLEKTEAERIAELERRVEALESRAA